VPKVEPFYVELGRRIRELRENARKISQAQLGRRLEHRLTRASIANIEAANQRVLAHTLYEVAKALKVDISELLPRDEQPIGDAVHKELKEKLPFGDVTGLTESLMTMTPPEVKDERAVGKETGGGTPAEVGDARSGPNRGRGRGSKARSSHSRG